MRHGEGLFEDRRLKLRYEGGWCKGKREGLGTAYFSFCANEEKDSKENETVNNAHQSYYRGEWAGGQRSGKGVMVYSSGNVFDGEWKNDMRDGYGEMLWKDLGERYSGSWKENKQSGQGRHVWLLSQGNKTSLSGEKDTVIIPQHIRCNQYDGSWEKGQRNGIGTFLFADGARYVGSWSRNKKHGLGTYVYTDGRVYEGEFDNDRMVNAEPILEQGVSLSQLRIDMPIDDLFMGTGVDGRRLRREVENVFLRWNYDLREIYLKCSRFQHRSASNDSNQIEREDFTVSLEQFHHLLRFCNVIDDKITLVRVNRIVHGVLNDSCSGSEIHSNGRKILYREFLEAILRIADVKYSQELDLSTVGMRLIRLLHETLKVALEADACGSILLMGDAIDEGCVKAFELCSVLAEEPLSECDVVATPRSIVQCLQQAGFIGQPGFSVDIETPEEAVNMSEVLKQADENDDHEEESIEDNGKVFSIIIHFVVTPSC